jgi:type I restriction enzyme S subunit
MIAALKPYPEYKPADAGWLGEIPAHWKVRRMKYVMRETDSRSTSGKEQLLRISQYTGVTQRRRAEGLEEPDTRADSLIGYKRVEPNDLVINIMLAWNGSMGVSSYTGIASPAYCVYRFGQDVDPWYLHNLLRSPAYKARIKASSTGVVESRLRLYSDDLGRIEAILPPPEEQAAIVRFLDWANGRLERTVRAKRKVITLLSEQKQAIIHRAVTGGLDPSVPLKPCGIPWLGDVPRNWDVGKVKRFFRTCSGSTPSSGQVSLYYNGTIPWIRTMDLNNGILATYVVGITQKAIDDTACKVLPVGSVLVAMYGGAGTIGKNGLLAIEASTNQALCALLPSDRVEPKYALFFMQYYRRYWMVGADGTRKDPNISQDRIRESLIIVPPLPEQRRIIEHIEEGTSGLMIAISRLEREIELLREYRTRLVADVVTGKLDVREAAGKLHSMPDEAVQAPDAMFDAPDDVDDADAEELLSDV